jgi:predicted transposase/invertase (TIGR01784 family)
MLHRLDPTLDVVFKLLFADPSNKRLLISLLQAVLQPDVPIGDVTVLNPELPKELVGDRGAELDVLVTLEDARRVDVEMQSQTRRALPERRLFYWAGMYRSQLGRGDDYSALAPCASIFILKRPELAGSRYHSTHRVLEVHDHTLFSPALELHTLELSKLPPHRPGHPDAPVVNWGRFLAAKTDEELERLAMTDPDLQRAKDFLDFLSARPDAQELARQRELALLNYRTQINLARQEGEREGEKRGEKRGRAEGLREAVLRICVSLGIEVDSQRRMDLDRASVQELERFVEKVTSDRRWPGGR